jgi:signal transduction histidine kinase
MKLGLRLALVTALLTGSGLGLAAWLVVAVRRADLESDLRDRFREVATTLTESLEPVDGARVQDDLPPRLKRMSATLTPFHLELLSSGANTAGDPGWAQLAEKARIDEGPAGRIFEPAGRPAFFAMAVPLREGPAGTSDRKVVAVVGIRRSTAEIERAVELTLKQTLPVVGAGGVLFGLMVFLLLRGGVLAPLRRLNDAIEGVAKGDLSRAVLPHRDDEIGALASRFNEMTDSLREARSDGARAQAARSAMQTRLRHSEKLAAMGQMAAQIAHEVGTPLNVIGGRARSLVKRAADPGEVAKNAEIIAGQVERIARIIRQVLSFSRKSRPALTEVDVADVITEAIGFVEETAARQGVVTVVEVPAGGLGPVPGDPAEIQQVCLNLINNALQAMPSGGRLCVRLDRVNRRKEGLALTAPTSFLMVEVSDTGPGVPRGDRERIFEPFFTTKTTGEGTGLGLAVSQGIVKDHDGWMEVDDGGEGGAVFRVFLPVASPDLAEGDEMRKDQARR